MRLFEEIFPHGEFVVYYKAVVFYWDFPWSFKTNLNLLREEKKITYFFEVAIISRVMTSQHGIRKTTVLLPTLKKSNLQSLSIIQD